LAGLSFRIQKTTFSITIPWLIVYLFGCFVDTFILKTKIKRKRKKISANGCQEFETFKPMKPSVYTEKRTEQKKKRKKRKKKRRRAFCLQKAVQYCNF